MSTTTVEVQLKRFNSMERRPRMLKDFLSENSYSCSSSGFKSLPRKPNDTKSIHTSLIEMDQLKPKIRKNSSNNYSPFKTLINTITSISFFTAVKKSPSMIFLPRSLSRKLSASSRSRRNQSFCKGGSSSTVKIKDIIRWKSFRDLVEEHHHHQPPLDFHRCIVGSATTTTTTTTCSSSGSSWSDSDFTSGYLSSGEAQNDNVEAGKKKISFSPLVVGKDLVEPPEYTAVVGAKKVLTCQEYEQNSPVSVLVGEDDFSLFDQSLTNIQRRKQKFMQTVQRFESLVKFDLEQSLLLDENSGYDEEEDDDDHHDDVEVEEQNWVEERARQLLHCVKATDSVHSCKDYLDTLLLDFLREELSGRRNQTRNDDKFEWEIMRKAEDWINGSFAYDIEHVNKDTYIKDMDRRGRWSMFEVEKEELTLEIERAILHSLVADLLDG